MKRMRAFFRMRRIERSKMMRRRLDTTPARKGIFKKNGRDASAADGEKHEND